MTAETRTLLSLGYSRDVGGEDQVRAAGEDLAGVRRQGLAFEHVERGTAELSVTQCSGQGRLVDDAADARR